MKLTRATISVAPFYSDERFTEISVKVHTDSRSFNYNYTLTRESFVLEFDQVWELMKRELDKLIADATKGETAK